MKNPPEFAEWLEENDDELYIAYMETGAYYDTDREAFDEWMYESWLKENGYAY